MFARLIFMTGLVLASTLGAGQSARAAPGDTDGVLEIEPAAVPAPGEYTFTLTASGWERGPFFVMPCTVAPDAEPPMPALAGYDCDQDQVVSELPGDFETTATWTVGSEGLVIVISPINAFDWGLARPAATVSVAGQTPQLVETPSLAETGTGMLAPLLFGLSSVGLGLVLVGVRHRPNHAQ